MKIDQEYLKNLLEVCQSSEGPTFDIFYLKESGIDYEDPLFEFHMGILTDQRLIERDDGDPGFGLQKGIDGFHSWSCLPLRLTASGHHFIEALSNKEVWAAIKSGFKDLSIETLKKVSFELLEGFAKKKIGDILGA